MPGSDAGVRGGEFIHIIPSIFTVLRVNGNSERPSKLSKLIQLVSDTAGFKPRPLLSSLDMTFKVRVNFKPSLRSPLTPQKYFVLAVSSFPGFKSFSSCSARACPWLLNFSVPPSFRSVLRHCLKWFGFLAPDLHPASIYLSMIFVSC